ncbi:MAG: DUF2171 domain-containing protein [Sphingomonas sp.]|uniref:DUF2171 domain-containing protein n=1 Tax=Sphingomonas sp. TaxID=28214 RepID=UPI001AC85FDA|nr:DUF2171 domain-containing protein [Sphingomonas sp.]MBN8806961.1 DUF2171 domain-containing protein [Sphingomonas sp.]
MVYERYPRDELSGDEFRGAQGGDRNRQYGARDYSAGQSNRGFGNDRFQNRDASDWRSSGSDDDQRGYYSAGSTSDLYGRGARYGGSYGDDYGASGSSQARDYGRGGYGQSEYGRSSQNRDFQSRGDYGRSNHGQSDYGRPDMYRGQRGQQQDYNYKDRTFFDRAGDEVRSWFGDDEAERRRELDQRYDQRYARGDERDQDYHSWRSGQIASLDRDYDEYRRENQSKFHNEFGSWRTDRQGQRDSLSRVTEHMDVVGSDGEHVGTVDKVRGDRLILTKSDADAGGRHHSVPSRWIERVEDKVTLRKTADEAKSHWRDEERNESEGRGAFFNEDRDGDRDTDSNGRILNRSFSGTY